MSEFDNEGRIGRVVAQIDLDALAFNYKGIRRIVRPQSDVMAVVKADAYGHGAVEAAETLLSCGVKRLAVAILEEAIQLRRSGIEVPILILGHSSASQADDVIRYGLTQTVFSFEAARALSEAAVLRNRSARIHIKVDTGMGRIGFFPDREAVETILRIRALPRLEIEGMYTHFPSADEEDKSFARTQVRMLRDFDEKLRSRGVHIPLVHAANSAGIMDLEESHLDCVRPGVILYGLYPSDWVRKEKLPLKPVMTLKSRIVHVKDMEAGMTVSYGRTFKTERKSRIATIPVGYADGYPRSLSSRGKVIVKGHVAPIAGKICMDQFMIDVTGIPDVETGDEVILLGSDGALSVTADEMAAEAGTINYEIVCRIGKRVPRLYLKDGKPVKIVSGISG